MAELRDGHVRASLVAKFALPLAIVALIPSLIGLKLYGDQAAEQRELREEFQRAAASSTYQNCVKIERLKKAQRDAALESFRNLPQTTELLELKLTPLLRAIARQRRDQTLRRFAPEDCGSLSILPDNR